VLETRLRWVEIAKAVPPIELRTDVAVRIGQDPYSRAVNGGKTVLAYIVGAAEVKERRELDDAVTGLVKEQWHPELRPCHNAAVAHQRVFTIAADSVDSAHAELLERQQRVVGPLHVAAQNHLIGGVEEPLDVLE